MADQQFCLRWNNHQSTLISVFDSLQERGCMVDCTLAAEGQSLQAHKVVLSACSPYLEDLLSKHYDKHPILLLKDVKFEELRAMLDYMYRGEVNVAQDKLNSFLRAAESLQIKGLSDGGTDPPDTGGTSGVKRTSKGAPVSVRSNQALSVRSTNLVEESIRDGSVSPSLRKRRRRRGSEEGSEHDSSSNVLDGRQSSTAAAPITGPSVMNQELLPTVPSSGPADANLLLSSIMESAETENATDSGISSATNSVPPNSQVNNVIRDKDSTLVEPKTEYLDDDAQELPMDEDDGMFRAGPSHARGSGNFVGDGEDYLTGQDSGANAQGDSSRESSPKRSSWGGVGVAWEKWVMQHVQHPLMPVMLARSSSPLDLGSGSSIHYPSSAANGSPYSGSSSAENSLIGGGLDDSFGRSGEKVEECSRCGRRYKLKSSLRNHIKWECGKEPQFQCPFCSYRAKQKMHVVRHVERMHKEKIGAYGSSAD